MRCLRSKYKVRHNWLQSEETAKNASPIWRAIEKAKGLIRRGACYQVGDGKSIDVWMDPWIPWIEGFKPKPKENSVNINTLLVHNLINSNTKKWMVEKLTNLFDATTVEAIIKIIITSSTRHDKLIWIKDLKGRFSTKSAYRVSQEHKVLVNNDVQWQSLWKLKLHDRTKMLLWRIGVGILPTKENLAHRIVLEDINCSLCQEDTKSRVHLFAQCPAARAIWFGCKWGLRTGNLQVSNNSDIVKLVLESPIAPHSEDLSPKQEQEQNSLRMALTLEAIWNLRNQV